MQLTNLLSVKDMTAQEKGYDLLANVLKCMQGVNQVGSALMCMDKQKQQAKKMEGGASANSSSFSQPSNSVPPPSLSLSTVESKKRKHVVLDRDDKEPFKLSKRKKISIINHPEHSFQAFILLQTDTQLNFGRKLQFDSHQHFKKFANKVFRTDKDRFNKINDFIVTYGLPRLSKYHELQNGVCTSNHFKDYCKRQNEEIINIHNTTQA